MPDDSDLATSIRVLARAHQDAIWDRMHTASKLRSLLREYYPAFLATFEDLTNREARATLHLAPSPADSTRLRKNSLTAALRRAGRRRRNGVTAQCVGEVEAMDDGLHHAAGDKLVRAHQGVVFDR